MESLVRRSPKTSQFEEEYSDDLITLCQVDLIPKKKENCNISQEVIEIKDDSNDEETKDCFSQNETQEQNFMVSGYGKKSFVLPVTFFDSPKNIKLLSECKPMSVKVIDYKKHPRHFYKGPTRFYKPGPKSRKRLIFRPKTDAILKCNDEDDVIILSDSETNHTKEKHQSANIKCSAGERKHQQATISNKRVKKRMTLYGEVQVKPSNIGVVDFKRNTGLVGLKITHGPDLDRIPKINKNEKDNVSNKYKDTKSRKQENTEEGHDLFIHSIDQALLRLGTEIYPVLDPAHKSDQNTASEQRERKRAFENGQKSDCSNKNDEKATEIVAQTFLTKPPEKSHEVICKNPPVKKMKQMRVPVKLPLSEILKIRPRIIPETAVNNDMPKNNSNDKISKSAESVSSTVISKIDRDVVPQQQPIPAIKVKTLPAKSSETDKNLNNVQKGESVISNKVFINKEVHCEPKAVVSITTENRDLIITPQNVPQKIKNQKLKQNYEAIKNIHMKPETVSQIWLYANKLQTVPKPCAATNTEPVQGQNAPPQRNNQINNQNTENKIPIDLRVQKKSQIHESFGGKTNEPKQIIKERAVKPIVPVKTHPCIESQVKIKKNNACKSMTAKTKPMQTAVPFVRTLIHPEPHLKNSGRNENVSVHLLSPNVSLPNVYHITTLLQKNCRSEIQQVQNDGCNLNRQTSAYSSIATFGFRNPLVKPYPRENKIMNNTFSNKTKHLINLSCAPYMRPVPKGYSPPILPIPTVEKGLEMLGMSSLQTQKVDEDSCDRNLTYKPGPKSRKLFDRFMEHNRENRNSNDERNKEAKRKKISLDEYKKRQLSIDLGYHSDTSVKLG